MDREAIFSTGHGGGGAGRGGARPKIYGAERGVAGNHPLPTVRGKNLQGWEGPGRGTYCMN